MQVKVVKKTESKIRSALQKEIIKTMKEFKKSLKTKDNNVRLNFIKLLRLGIGLSNDVPYRKDFEEEKFNFMFEKSIYDMIEKMESEYMRKRKQNNLTKSYIHI